MNSLSSKPCPQLKLTNLFPELLKPLRKVNLFKGFTYNLNLVKGYKEGTLDGYEEALCLVK